MPGNAINHLAFTEDGPSTMAQSFRQREAHLTCPFNESHSILPERMLKHILKCKKNHPEVAATLIVCPFSPQTHFLKPEDYDHHVLHCPIGVERMRWFRDQKYIV